MKLNYKKPKGQRLKKNHFLWIDVVSPEGNDWWIAYNEVYNRYRTQRQKDGGGKWINRRGSTDGRWIKYHEREDYDYLTISSAGPFVKSVKAFKRLCVKWSTYLPKGTKIYLHSIWQGHDIIYIVK